MEKILKTVLSVLMVGMGLLACGADDAIPLKDMWDTNRLYTAEMVDSKISQAVEGGDYNTLTNKPSIGGVVLEGNKTASALGLQPTIADYTTTGAVQNIVEGYGYATETAVAGALNGKQDKLPYSTNAIPQSAVSGLTTDYLRMEWDNHEPTYTRIAPMDFGLGLYYREWWETDWSLKSRWTRFDLSIWGDEFMTLEGGDAPGLWIGMDWEGRYQGTGGGTWYANGFIYNIKGGEWSCVFLPKGIGEGSDNVMAITKDIDRATNAVVRGLSTAKWSLSNVTNASGGAVSAADVGAAGASEVVKLTGDQSISGTKTFDAAAYFNGGLAAPSTIAVYGQDSSARFEVDNIMTGDFVHFGVDVFGVGIGFEYTKNGSSYSVELPNRSGVLSVDEGWASTYRALNEANTNAITRAQLCGAIEKATDGKPHFAIIDGEVHIISITETEDNQ